MKKILLCYILIFAIFSACASKSKKSEQGTRSSSGVTKVQPAPDVPSIEAKQLANEQQTSFVTEFTFKKGSEELSAASKQKLREISQNALARGKVEMIKVISWADQEYPTANQKKLSEDQLELANNRNEEIKNYLDDLYEKRNMEPDVQLISMAKRPNAFNNLISSDDARIKKSLETSGIPTTGSKNKTGPKSSKAIVLIKLEDKPR